MDMNNNNTENGVFSQNGETPKPQNTEANVYGDATYAQPVYTQTPEPVKDETVSILDWVGTILLSCIPCVGMIIYIIWAFSKDTKKSKANFCKAQLIIALAGVVLYIIIFIIAMVAGIVMAYAGN